MFFKKERSVIDDEEKLLKYLIDTRDETNKVRIGTDRYKKIDGFTPEQVLQTLLALRGAGYISIYFYGQESVRSMCLVTILEPGLTYFEDQKLDEQAERDKNHHDYAVQLFTIIVSGVVGFILGRLTS